VQFSNNNLVHVDSHTQLKKYSKDGDRVSSITSTKLSFIQARRERKGVREEGGKLSLAPRAATF